MDQAEITTRIYDKLVEILETLKGDGQPFVEVYGYNEPDNNVFPIACVDLIDGGIQENASSHTKTLKNNFLISCLFRQAVSTEASRQRMLVLGQVYQKFTEDGIADYLGGTTERLDISHRLRIAESGNQPIYILEFLLDTYNVMTVY